MNLPHNSAAVSHIAALPEVQPKTQENEHAATRPPRQKKNMTRSGPKTEIAVLHNVKPYLRHGTTEREIVVRGTQNSTNNNR